MGFFGDLRGRCFLVTVTYADLRGREFKQGRLAGQVLNLRGAYATAFGFSPWFPVGPTPLPGPRIVQDTSVYA